MARQTLTEDEVETLRRNMAANPSVSEIWSILVGEADRLGLGHDGRSTHASKGGTRYLHLGRIFGDGLWNYEIEIRVSNHGGRVGLGRPGTTLTTTQDPAELQKNIQAAFALMVETSDA